MKMSRPLEVPQTKELASLAISLNKMAKELDKRIKQIQIEKRRKSHSYLVCKKELLLLIITVKLFQLTISQELFKHHKKENFKTAFFENYKT